MVRARFLPYIRMAPIDAAPWRKDMMEQRQDKHERQEGGIVIPALLWWAGVPLIAVILLWALFFRG